MKIKKRNYEKLSLPKLDELAAEYKEAIWEARADLVDATPIPERLKVHEEVAHIRGHLAVVNELRTKLYLEQEFEASRLAAKLRGQISEATYRALKQEIGTGAVAPLADASGPGVVG